MGIFIVAFVFEFLDRRKKNIRTAMFCVFSFYIVCTFIDSELTFSLSKSYLVKKIIFNIPMTYYDCSYGIILETSVYFLQICMIYVLVLLVRDYLKTRRKEIVPIIIGFVLFFISATTDLVASDEFIYTLGYAFFALIICMAYSLAQRFVVLHETVSRIKDELYDLNQSLESKVVERTQELSAALSELEATNDALVDARDALWGEMQIAKKIQTVLLPKEPELPGFEISCYMQPADEVGGDYYDVITVAGKNWIVIGDVSGHGVPAGIIMMMVQTSIQVVINGNPGIPPSNVLNAINAIISSNIKRMNESKYMTITVIAAYDNGRFYYSGLHQNILVYRAKENKVESIETTGMWIGLIENFPGIFDDNYFEMQSGDMFLLFTDGVTEAWKKGRIKDHRSMDCDMFGEKKLADILQENGKEPPDAVQNKIIESLVDYQLDDDVTLVIAKRL
jgi:serine phosphatase RsbU (regulator of sigma subunit)